MRLALPATLACVSLLFGGAIVYESVAPLDPVVVAIARPNPNSVRLVIPPAYAPPPEDMFADIDARPLFSNLRKPLTDPAQSGAIAAPTDYSLAGVISGGDRSVALLRSKSASTTASAVVGDVVGGGWHVTRIDPTSVTLHANGADYVLMLEGPADRPPSAALPTTAGQPPTLPGAPAPSAMAAQPPPLSSGTTASAVTAKPVFAPPNYHPTIAPEALKGAPRDPTTGEPTL